MEYLDSTAFFKKTKILPVLDVRSPSEFKQGHITGAVNLPLFDDEERKITGTLYKNSGRYDSFLKGLEFAGPKLSYFVKQAHKLAPHHSLLLHCWRGGMRSRSMAWLLETAGFRVCVLEGGYKSYRKLVHDSFLNPLQLIVVGGMTGSGKSQIIRELEKNGEQVIDLESLAGHKGSAFGSIGYGQQPTNEQFENDLHACISGLEPERPVWIEDESIGIGRVQIPGDLFHQMREAPVVLIEIPKKARIQHLVDEYGILHKDSIRLGIDQIVKRLGGLKTKEALQALDAGELSTTARILLSYYDKAYFRGLSRRKPSGIQTMVCRSNDPVKNARKIIRWKNNQKIFHTEPL